MEGAMARLDSSLEAAGAEFLVIGHLLVQGILRYLDEEAFRFNSRKVKDGERFRRLSSAVQSKRLTYRELTGATARPA
jgi:hypothetical protein